MHRCFHLSNRELLSNLSNSRKHCNIFCFISILVVLHHQRQKTRFGQETVLDGQQTFTLEEPVGAEAEEQLCKTLEAGKVVRQVVGVLAH